MAQASVGLGVVPFARGSASWRSALLWVQDHVTGRDRELARLDWQIESVRARMAGQPSRFAEAWEGKDAAPDRPDPMDEVLHLLDKAAAAREQHDAGRGWALVSRAEELEVSFLGRHQLEAARRSLQCEIALDEEAGWWREAALDLLRRMSPGPTGAASAPSAAVYPASPAAASDAADEAPARRSTQSDLRADREYLREARRIRNDLNSSRYTAMEANTAQRIWLSVILIGLLAVAGRLIWAHLSTRSSSLDTPWLAASAAAAGTIGAVTSAMQRLCARPRAQPPAHLGSLTTAIVHALIGAVAALTFYFAA
ncbi:MAG TPA: hypothetical protein VFN43_04680, partial [Humibacillus sp.]|nr:hypothetical protein [Humibacillus sp.]